MDLSAWQDRLERHFTELRNSRQAAGPNRPVFALEHGLDGALAEDLATDLRARGAAAAGFREYALPWIVYAAEIGYGYSGDEYWQTFESKTPGWITHGDRDWIRECFRLFHRQFGGAKPSGSWAEHFSIICWPITHAILPKDLQRQLAHVLYDLRHSFSADLLNSPPMLGELIAARSWNTTSRFQNLTHETALVGQIAAALLLEGELGTADLIHPGTLRRIGDDLDGERRAREWLRGARKMAQERAKVRGLALGSGQISHETHGREEVRSEIVALGIEPRLVLRPTETERATWAVSLELPDLSPLLLRFPGARETLTGSRCVVAGAAGRPLARGRCLYGTQRVPLARWPRTDEVLLQFEKSDPQLSYVLSTECLLRPGTTWLFRIASDGLAYESRSLRVRPGQQYVVVSSAAPLDASPWVAPVELECEGVYGARLDLPTALTGDWESRLRRIGLGLAKTIEVWPAGLAAAAWDGEGHGEWLASETPCLAIRTDHAVHAVVVTMRGTAEPPLEVTSISAGEAVFVELPQLPVGVHGVRVSVRNDPAAKVELVGDLDVVMRIRDAHPWSPGVSPRGPLLVQMDPAAPTLEELWEGRLELTLRGSTGRAVKCTARLLGADPTDGATSKELPPIALPVTAPAWTHHFEKHFRETKWAERAYDTARVCELDFEAGELGSFQVRAEREFTPLRWVVRRQAQGSIVRLMDDSGSNARPIVEYLAFETPSVRALLEPRTEYRVPDAGGLYVARLGALTASVIAPPMIHGFRDLRCVPRVDKQGRSAEAVARLLELARAWGGARLPGDIVSTTRQRDVLRALTRETFRVIAGDNWAEAERLLAEGDVGGIKRIATKHQEAAFFARVLRDRADLATAPRATRLDLIAVFAIRVVPLPEGPTARIAGAGVTLVKRVWGPNQDDPHWLAELALRLASSPVQVDAWAGAHLGAGIKRLLDWPGVARVARCLVVATDRHLGSRVAGGELYAGWGWG